MIGVKVEGSLVHDDRVEVLPHGWLRDEEARVLAECHGFVAVDLVKDREIDPIVRGWGMTAALAIEAAARHDFAAKNLQVLACTKDLHSRLGLIHVACWLRNGVAYSREETPPLEEVVEWIAFATMANKRPDMPEREWDAMRDLVQRIVIAYLDGHPMVGATSQGYFGWTDKAKKRRAVQPGEIVAPISSDVVIAAQEVIANLKDKEIERAFKRVMKKQMKARGQVH